MGELHGSAPSPVQRLRVTSTDLDEATALLRSRYAEHHPSFHGSREGFAFGLAATAVAAPAGTVSVDGLRHSMRASALAEPLAAPTVVVPLRGRVRYACGRDEAGAGPTLCPTWDRFRVEWDDVELAVGSVDADGLARVASEIHGIEPDAVAFTGMTAISASRARYVHALLRHLEQILRSHDEVMASPLARAETFRQLAVGLLQVFPNTTHTADAPRSPGFHGPATVRRAVAFIDGHAHEDISLTEIARAARLGPRGLQSAFHRHLGTTPLTYLRKARMAGAHADLQAGDPTRGDTVGAIAARWGFANAGRFSVEYRQVYARSPRETLRS
ncbi:helix-turn-helix transcriptional regulator [Actinomycetospora flava]|uniref:Helix-turn-helix transcriptional regulator n=1 Tax=Actinomycetospora flava TaxID=3129232 RepID=A0ABU8M8W5_9PSEU